MSKFETPEELYQTILFGDFGEDACLKCGCSYGDHATVDGVAHCVDEQGNADDPIFESAVVQNVIKHITARDAALTAKVREECAERAIAWRHKKYSCTVPGVDEELAAAIVGKEGEE